MVLRLLLAFTVVLSVGAPTASAAVVPLKGEGENIEGVVRVEIDAVNELELAGDWAFLSLDTVESDDPAKDREGGLAIVNIADPERPFIQGMWTGLDAGIQDASFGDVDLSTDANLAVLTNAHCDPCEEGKVLWAVLIDVSDKSNPKLMGKIVDDGTMDYVHTATLDNKTLYLNPQVAAFYPQPGNAHITVFDISDPTKPVKKGVIEPPGADAGLAHDSYVDHRPDGKTLMYAASVHKSDVMDITNPLEPNYLQSVTSPSYTISHDVQPNHDRSIILVDDEGAAGGQLDETVSACGKAGAGQASADSGSLHFFAAAPDGTFADNGAAHLGSFNAPANANTGACVAHVFWQAPNENRLTQAYYRTGVFVIEFEDPSAPKALGSFVPEGGGMYWSNKPHRGYLFASDMLHGLDILRYTGEGASRWPATAGPAEVQRSARQGVPYVPIAGTATPNQPGGNNNNTTGGTPQQVGPATLPIVPSSQSNNSARPRPQPRACTSRRTIRLRVRRVPRRARVRSLTVSVTGQRTRRLRGNRRVVRLDLRGAPRGTVRVRIVARTTRGRRYVDRRTYRLCTPRPR